jgi:hypothetical protein
MELSIGRVVIPKLPNPRVDFPQRGKCRQTSDICGKRVLLGVCGPQNGAPVLEDELDTVTLPQSQAMSDLDGNCDLPLAADRAGWWHLYLYSLQ